MRKFTKYPCQKCGAMLQKVWLKDGICNACRNPDLVVGALDKPDESDAKQALVDKAIEQIKRDIEMGDVTALDCLLNNLSETDLLAYLPSEG